MHLGDLGPNRKLLLKSRNFSFTVRFVCCGANRNLSLQIEQQNLAVKIVPGDLGPNRKLLFTNRNFSFTVLFLSSGGSQILSLQIECAISMVKTVPW